MSTTTVTSTEPTLAHYQCGGGCSPLSFKWTKPMPQGGWLGEVTFAQYTNKPIQVFDAKPIYVDGYEVGRNWGFQAQDGSFVGRMYVALYKSYIRFAHFRPNDQWPQVACFVTSNPDPRDSREAIENAA